MAASMLHPEIRARTGVPGHVVAQHTPGCSFSRSKPALPQMMPVTVQRTLQAKSRRKITAIIRAG